MTWLVLALVVVILVAALAALFLENFPAAVAATSVVSFGVAVAFVLLRAPDVAMTEATVGAGLGGLILALAMRRLGIAKLDTDQRKENPDA